MSNLPSEPSRVNQILKHRCHFLDGNFLAYPGVHSAAHHPVAPIADRVTLLIPWIQHKIHACNFCARWPSIRQQADHAILVCESSSEEHTSELQSLMRITYA